ncbi:MAG: prepilin-type cleavage/methylation domain-containing protein [Deltaproteobacteria bacterium]|nr:MAG: prepilin-type cleavage/methylation domain-containing protein [Deltaproteobacteria bacterium]
MKLKNRSVNGALNKKGFTLVELMIVVIIIGILTAVGVPLYLGYVKDAKVSSAKAVIGTIVNAEKVEHQKTGSFKEVTTEQFEGDPANNPLGIDVRDATQFWTLSVTDVDADGFKVTATGKAGTDYEDTEVILDYSRSGDETWTIS